MTANAIAYLSACFEFGVEAPSLGRGAVRFEHEFFLGCAAEHLTGFNEACEHEAGAEDDSRLEVFNFKAHGTPTSKLTYVQTRRTFPRKGFAVAAAAFDRTQTGDDWYLLLSG